jgi:regulator of sirC expression with transglutaminase-like and TPR domain
MTSSPQHCRPSAYSYLARQLPRLDTTAGLVHAAVAVSMHQLGDINIEQIDAELDRLARVVKVRVRTRQPRALVAHLHSALFDEAGFCGNTEDYYHPANSYLPKVLQTRRGLPVVLALIYRAVAERVGLVVHGVNSPGHFLAAVEVEKELLLIDTFDRGRLLSRQEMCERIAQTAGHAMMTTDEPLPYATNRQWLARIILNLLGLFTRQGPPENVHAMREMLALVEAA